MSYRKLREENFDRDYKSPAEQAFVNLARVNGWQVTGRGYPDFICYRNGELMLVEVKASKRHRLKSGQWLFMNTMKKYGVKCYRWSPDNPWTPC